MQKFDLKQTIRRVRQNWWFEKYIWFISSELLGISYPERHMFHIFSSLFGQLFPAARVKNGPVLPRNYLVISGHDAIQTEQLFLKHVGPTDAFVQADVAGARTCFVRNPSGREHTGKQFHTANALDF